MRGLIVAAILETISIGGDISLEEFGYREASEGERRAGNAGLTLGCAEALKQNKAR